MNGQQIHIVRIGALIRHDARVEPVDQAFHPARELLSLAFLQVRRHECLFVLEYVNGKRQANHILGRAGFVC